MVLRVFVKGSCNHCSLIVSHWGFCMYSMAVQKFDVAQIQSNRKIMYKVRWLTDEEICLIMPCSSACQPRRPSGDYIFIVATPLRSLATDTPKNFFKSTEPLPCSAP